MDLLEIPSKDDPEYDDAIYVLVESAEIYRQLLASVIVGGANPKAVLKDNAEVLAHSELATLSWLSHLRKKKMN